jgi:hypothetical protein
MPLDWEHRKELLRDFYLTRDKSLNYVMKLMKEEYNFVARYVRPLQRCLRLKLNHITAKARLNTNNNSGTGAFGRTSAMMIGILWIVESENDSGKGERAMSTLMAFYFRARK